VWALVSALADRVLERTQELARATERLNNLQAERTNHLIRTTHELKAPFAAVTSYLQLLREGDCGELPPTARDVVEKMWARCGRMTDEIAEMLQLANLRATADEEPAPPPGRSGLRPSALHARRQRAPGRTGSRRPQTDAAPTPEAVD
jgi:signal transduction histidine kinase